MYATKAKKLLDGATAANGAPTGDAGVPLGQFVGDAEAVIWIHSTAGHNAVFKLWLKSEKTGKWHAVGTLNNGAPVTENYAEIVRGLNQASRAYLQITTYTSGTITAELTARSRRY